MIDWTPTADERERIFEQQILPVIFGEAPSPEEPSLVLLGGQVGAGMSRATARLLREASVATAVVSSDDLRAFHPHYLALARSGSAEAPEILAEAAAEWLRRCLAHARSTRHSMILEGTFRTPEVALGLSELFAREGFSARVVVVAAPRSESLLATASRHLLEAQAGRASRFTSVEVHDSGWEGTRALVSELVVTPAIDRLTILGRDGAARFDAERSTVGTYAGAADALDRERSATMSASTAMRWLSELRAMTDAAVSWERISRSLADVLIELHRVALDEVLPALILPADSRARPAAEANIARQLVVLRRAADVEPLPEDIAAPAIATAQPDRGLSR